MGSSPEDPDLETLLGEQLVYYRARADEYDDWWLRLGRYDRGSDENRSWLEQAAVAQAALEAELDALPRGARVLELACGTGLWTERIAAHGHVAELHAVDAAPEVLVLNRERVNAAGLEARVLHEQADLFSWRPPRGFDLVFFGFWLSHVPAERFDSFWSAVDEALRPGGRFFLVDNLRTPHHPFSDQNGDRARRRLLDGREFDIVKIFYEPAELEQRLRGMGYEASMRGTDDFFLFGSGGRPA